MRGSIAANRYVDLIADRVGSHRVRTGCGGHSGIAAWGRTGVLDAERGRGRAGEVIVIASGIVPILVGAALTGHYRDGAAVAIVDDQRVGATTAERELVCRADGQPLRTKAAGGAVDRKHLLDFEGGMSGDTHHRAVMAAGAAADVGQRQIELPVAMIELALLDAVRQNLGAIGVRSVKPDLPLHLKAVLSDERDEVIGRIVVRD